MILVVVGRVELELVGCRPPARHCGQIASMSVRSRQAAKIMLTTCAVRGPLWILKAVIPRA